VMKTASRKRPWSVLIDRRPKQLLSPNGRAGECFLPKMTVRPSYSPDLRVDPGKRGEGEGQWLEPPRPKGESIVREPIKTQSKKHRRCPEVLARK